MTSFFLDTADTTPPAYAPASSPALSRPLRNRWSYGRGYTVVALLAPVLLTSLVLIYLHNTTKTRLSLWRLRLWQ
ncbi:hypothetical protein PGN35_011490 [Nodosilinea sp. PGN35]|uniref:hypothetical protein n=1 Tax=Nodosilinea sp. PGN35 TaxID=3020489 RepID=UPI0023B32109|nr:hypothetical protein [Nodosilinea sp. TSF1-S3]MDF0366346.1 hypothetical protein [Nodosilinea sp. TSF1-S3]